MAWQPNPGMGKAHETAQARMSVNKNIKQPTKHNRIRAESKGCKRVNAHVRYARSTQCTWLMFVALIVYVRETLVEVHAALAQDELKYWKCQL